MEHREKNTLVIRADAGTQIGTGHLMRCLALGQAWKDDGGEVTFITTCRNESLLQLLRKENFIVHLLDAPHPDNRDWRCSRDIILSHPDSWVVLDGYHFDEAYQKKVKETGLRLLVIDDIAHLKYYSADILLNQNLGADKLPYLCEPYTRRLLGTRYIMLRREFRSRIQPIRRIKQRAYKLLVSLGGSDPENYTLKVIQAVQNISLPDLKVIIIAGANNPHLNKLERNINNADSFRIVYNPQNMFEMMKWADTAVSSGGTTIWELAFTGVPTILIIQAENQRFAAEALDQAGNAVYLGWADKISIKELSTEIEKFLLDKIKRRNISCGLQKLVDGEGTSRLIMQIKDEKLRLRPTNSKDCKILWQWANDPLVREAAFSSMPIPWEKHLLWFKQKQKDTRFFQFIAIDEQDIPIGQIRFDVHGEEAEVDVSIDRQRRRQAYGHTLIKRATEKMFALNRVKVIHSYIKPENTASINAFKKAGFRELSSDIKQNQLALHLIRDKNGKN